MNVLLLNVFILILTVGLCAFRYFCHISYVACVGGECQNEVQVGLLVIAEIFRAKIEVR